MAVSQEFRGEGLNVLRCVRVVRAAAVAGTLDILAAIGLTLAHGRDPMAMLRYVASGPIPPATGCGAAGSALGLAAHFALMAVMTAVFVAIADRRPALKAPPVASGIGYGLATYVAMNLIVVPLRFAATFPPSGLAIATQLFCHIVLVGLPIAFIARR